MTQRWVGGEIPGYANTLIFMRFYLCIMLRVCAVHVMLFAKNKDDDDDDELSYDDRKTTWVNDVGILILRSWREKEWKTKNIQIEECEQWAVHEATIAEKLEYVDKKNEKQNNKWQFRSKIEREKKAKKAWSIRMHPWSMQTILFEAYYYLLYFCVHLPR